MISFLRQNSLCRMFLIFWERINTASRRRLGGVGCRVPISSTLALVKARDAGEALRQLMKGRQSAWRRMWMALQHRQGVKKKNSSEVSFFFFFFFYPRLLLHSPKMNWLFRFKKVHGWNTKRGSSISPWIVKENPMAVGSKGGAGEGCVVGLWLDPGPVLLKGLQRKHQSALLLWTTWDNFFTGSLLFKDFLYQMCQHMCQWTPIAAWLFIM